MDLSRVFADNAAAGGANTSSNASNIDFGALRSGQQQPPTMSAQQAFQTAYDVSGTLHQPAQHYQQAVEKLNAQLAQLREAADAAQYAHKAVCQERDNYGRLLQAAEGRLGEVQRVVQRYTVVHEPVVASDGYTYERKVIQQYLSDCEHSQVAPVSQQTQNELTSTLIPNQSLKKLVELLKTVKPSEVPPATARTSVPHFRESTSGTLNFLDEVDESAPRGKGGKGGRGGGKGPHEVESGAIHASDLEAHFTSTPQKDRHGHKNEKSGGSSGGQGRLHPCIRVYGFCNFKDDCTFARYPYEACLNNIKGKCRFGSQCKELHVNPQDPKYQNPRSTNVSGGGAGGGESSTQQQREPSKNFSTTAPPAPRSAQERKEAQQQKDSKPRTYDEALKKGVKK